MSAKIGGIILVIAALALTLIFGQISWPTEKEPTPVAPVVVPDPPIVNAARKALRQNLPNKITFEKDSIRLHQLPDDKAVLCLASNQCALIKEGKNILINQKQDAKRTLIKAAKEGEPQ